MGFPPHIGTHGRRHANTLPGMCTLVAAVEIHGAFVVSTSRLLGVILLNPTHWLRVLGKTSRSIKFRIIVINSFSSFSFTARLIHCLKLFDTARATNPVSIASFGEALGRVLWLPARSASLARFAPCFAQCTVTVVIVRSKARPNECGVSTVS